MAKTRGQTHTCLRFQSLPGNSVISTKLIGNRLSGNVSCALGRGSHSASRGLNRACAVVQCATDTGLRGLDLSGNVCSPGPHKTGGFCLERKGLRHHAA